jgi:hypothetical protein
VQEKVEELAKAREAQEREDEEAQMAAWQRVSSRGIAALQACCQFLTHALACSQTIVPNDKQ